MAQEPTPTEDVSAPAEQTEQSPPQLIVLSVTLPVNAGVVKVAVPPTTQIADIRSHLIDNPEGNFNTCFYLAFKGQRLSDSISLVDIPDFDLDSPSLVMVTDEFNEREVRIQIARLREILTGFKSSTSSTFGVDVGISYLADVAPGYDINPSPKSAADADDEVRKSISHPFANYEFDLEKSANNVFGILPEVASNVDTCVKSLNFSCWNPPAPHRRTAGDIMYLAVTTNELVSVHITCSVNGFFVSRSTDKTFDPSIKSYSGPTLPHVLSQLSPSFKTTFAKLQLATQKRHPHTYLLPSTQQAIPWLIQEPRVLPDSSRTLDVIVSASDNADSLATRDWNDDLCSAASLPHSTANEKVVRAQTLHRVYSEFVDASVKGVTQIIQKSLAGGLGDLNNGLGGQMFLHGGIFYSFAKDQGDTFGQETGGSAAAHVAVSKDVDGVSKVDSISSNNWIGLHTLGTCVVDFKGVRVVAQAVVPGILSRQTPAAPASSEVDASAAAAANEVIVYGSIDSGKVIRSNQEFHDLLGKLAAPLRLEQHPVTDAEGAQHILFTPVDVKGIVGNDGRKYLLDLGRLAPGDVQFLEQVDETTGNGDLPAYPHRMTLLRHELMEMYYENQLAKFVNEKRVEIAERAKDAPEDAEKETEIDLSGFDLKFNADTFMIPAETEGAETEELTKQKETVRVLSKFLQETILPAVTIELGTNPSSVPLDGERLTTFLHDRGINMRYLGRMALSLEKLDSAPSFLKELLTSEMISRAAKTVLRELLQEVPLHFASECIAHFFKCLFAANETVVKAVKSRASNKDFAYLAVTPASLDERLREEIASRFRYPSANLPEHLAGSSRRVALLRSIALKVGIQIKSKVYELASTDNEAIFETSDIINICPIAKYPEPKCTFADEILEHAVFSLRQGDKQTGQEIMTEALNIYEQVFGPVHENAAKIQHQLARMHHEAGDLNLCKIYQRRALLIQERLAGFDDPETLQQYLNLGFFECLNQNFSVGFKYMNHALKLLHIHCGTSVHTELAAADAQIAMLLAESKSDSTLSLQFLRRAISTYESVLGKQNEQTVRAYELYISSLLQSGEWEEALEYQELVNDFTTNRYVGDDEKSKNIVAASERVIQYLKQRIQLEKDEKAAKAQKAAEAAAAPKKPASAATPASSAPKTKSAKAKQVSANSNSVPSSANGVKTAAVATAADESVSTKGHLSIDELMNFIDGTGGKKKNKKGKK
ncbi:UNVERIFIED_CONTAM: Intracellular distribution of mitochondria [Siphonaria sp. JEL0065]|nr:Intracellular distribution of mitochondria [Siphonaria sp. JEL0065]